MEHGFAYGSKGNSLVGKQVMTAITTGGSQDAYQPGGFNQYTIRQYLVPFERTVTLCKMEYLPPFVIHGTHLITPEDHNTHAGSYKKVLIALRDNIFDLDEIMKHKYMNDLHELKKKNN
ncbi:MAG: NAD(P)H-dependent oxidoreductase [Bacteroidales bacterium]|nr:NAD(P)H-dependent oxidoreductase [Bacteroidales bacterium]MCF8403579.1 NAD(P)H-dependent oxidoreductase [Bacteroidales bacterium]